MTPSINETVERLRAQDGSARCKLMCDAADLIERLAGALEVVLDSYVQILKDQCEREGIPVSDIDCYPSVVRGRAALSGEPT